MIRNLLCAMLSLMLVVSCATAPVLAPCEPQIVAEYEDHLKNVIIMVDDTCDGVCDFSLLLQFMGVDQDNESLYYPIGKFTCEQGEEILKTYRHQMDNNSVNM